MSWFAWLRLGLFIFVAAFSWAACIQAGRLSREEEKEYHERNRS